MANDVKQCPFCAEDIKAAAIVCKHCKRDLPVGSVEVQPLTEVQRMAADLPVKSRSNTQPSEAQRMAADLPVGSVQVKPLTEAQRIAAELSAKGKREKKKRGCMWWAMMSVLGIIGLSLCGGLLNFLGDNSNNSNNVNVSEYRATQDAREIPLYQETLTVRKTQSAATVEAKSTQTVSNTATEALEIEILNETATTSAVKLFALNMTATASARESNATTDTTPPAKRAAAVQTPLETSATVPTLTSEPTSAPTELPANTFTPVSTNTFTPIPTVANTSTPPPTSTGTFTPASTSAFTPIPTSTNTYTPIPTTTFTPIPTATSTFTPVPNQFAAISGANLRSGPSTAYDVIGGVGAGQVLSVSGKNADSTWLQLNTGEWISASLVSGQLQSLPVVAAPAPPTLVPAVAVPPTPPPPVQAVQPNNSASLVQPAATPIWSRTIRGTTFTSDCPCNQGNVLNCSDFPRGREIDAQACFERCMELTGRDIHGLDRDKDGGACEWSW